MFPNLEKHKYHSMKISNGKTKRLSSDISIIISAWNLFNVLEYKIIRRFIEGSMLLSSTNRIYNIFNKRRFSVMLFYFHYFVVEFHVKIYVPVPVLFY